MSGRWRPLEPSVLDGSEILASVSEGPVPAGVRGGVVMSPDLGLRRGD
jgi:hypothetical protein